MKIYLDHAATTPTDARVLKAMQPYFNKKYGNASSLHSFGREAKEALEKSRNAVAKHVGCSPDEIYFCSSGTEANNTILKGIAWANKSKGKHIIIQKTEHDCVLNTAKWLETQGFEVTYLNVDEDGLVSPSDLQKTLRKDTVLVSIMYANNEIGTVQNIKELSAITRKHGAYFHTDAVQAFGKIPLELKNVDTMTVSSHKLYGPKGVGMMYIRSGTNITPLLHGGGHERGMRSSTENIAGIVGFAKAVELSFAEMKKEGARQTKLRDALIKKMLTIEESWLNGHPKQRLPNNANFGFAYVEGESLILLLDQKGIAASTGSACSSHDLKPSHVLTACGLKPEEAHGSLRITLGKNTTKQHLDKAFDATKEIVGQLRKISPLNKKVLASEVFEEHEHGD